jgi:hypothetical protein
MLICEFQGVVCVDGLVLESSEAHFGNEPEGDGLLVACVKITAHNHPATADSAPLFRALGVTLLSLLRGREPTTSSNQPRCPRFVLDLLRISSKPVAEAVLVRHFEQWFVCFL